MRSRDAANQTWVAEENGTIAGHLYGALLESPEYGKGAWVGPDGVSFDIPTCSTPSTPTPARRGSSARRRALRLGLR